MGRATAAGDWIDEEDSASATALRREHAPPLPLLLPPYRAGVIASSVTLPPTWSIADALPELPSSKKRIVPCVSPSVDCDGETTDAPGARRGSVEGAAATLGAGNLITGGGEAAVPARIRFALCSGGGSQAAGVVRGGVAAKTERPRLNKDGAA